MAVRRRFDLPRGFNPRQTPTVPVELNAGHNLASGLNAAFFFGLHPTKDFSPYANHISSISGVYSNKPSQLGAARSTADTTAFLEYGQGGVGANTPISHVFWGVPSTWGTLSGGKTPGGGGAAQCLSVQASPVSINVVRQSSAQVASASWTPLSGALYQIVVTYDGANICIYANGVMLGSPTGYTTGFQVAPGGTNYICLGDPGDAHFQGDLIQFRTYTRALSAAEVAQDYAEPFAMLRPVVRRRAFTLGSASAKALTPAGTATTTQAATLTRTRKLTAAGAASTSQTATVSHRLTVAGTASTTQAATLRRTRPLAAAGTAASSQTATLTRLRALTETGTATTSQAATLGRTRPLTVAGTASTTQAASLGGRSRPLAPAGTASTSQTGALHATRPLTVAGTATTTQSASDTRSRALTAAGTAGTSQSSPGLGKNGINQLSAAGSASTTQAATLHAIRALVASGLAVTSQAAAQARGRNVSPTASSATTGQTAQLGRLRALTPLGATAATGQTGAQSATRALRAAGVAATTQGAVMGRLRPLLAAGTAITTQSGGISASGLPIGDVPASHTIAIPLDTRTVLVPLDTRTIMISR